MKERCVRCGAKTEYDVNTPIEVRRYFIEGSGQLCQPCFHELWPTTQDVNNPQTHSKNLYEREDF